MKRLGRRLAIATFLFVIGIAFFIGHLYTFKVREIDESIKLSNIRIVAITKTERNHYTTYSYDNGSSGTIFSRVGNTYYALTAYHVVNRDDIVSFAVLTENDLSIREYIDSGGDLEAFETYYESFPNLDIVVFDKENDLAIIKFKSQDNLTALNIASHQPRNRDPVITISNPNGKHGVVSSGRITNNRPQTVHFDDKKDTLSVIKHNAPISYGSSGSALLNENYEIIGVNVGGQTVRFLNIDLQFLNRANAIPLHQVLKLIEKTKLEIEPCDS